jgi:hypothetical protein
MVKNKLRLWKLPQYKNIHSKHVSLNIHLPIWVPKRTTFGQLTLDEMRCYWEYIGEHIGNLGNPLGKKNPKKCNISHPPQKKKI